MSERDGHYRGPQGRHRGRDPGPCLTSKITGREGPDRDRGTHAESAENLTNAEQYEGATPKVGKRERRGLAGARGIGSARRAPHRAITYGA